MLYDALCLKQGLCHRRLQVAVAANVYCMDQTSATMSPQSCSSLFSAVCEASNELSKLDLARSAIS